MHLAHFSKKQYLFSIIVILAFTSSSFAQKFPNENHFVEKLRFGGSLGLSFQNDFFNVSLSPKVLYDLSSKTAAGIGLHGSYTNARNYTATTTGGSILGIYRPLPRLQLSGEFEELYVSRKLEYDGANAETSYWYPALFLGLGYNTGPVTIGIRYDVLYEERKSIYGSALMPFVRVFF